MSNERAGLGIDLQNAPCTSQKLALASILLMRHARFHQPSELATKGLTMARIPRPPNEAPREPPPESKPKPLPPMPPPREPPPGPPPPG